MFVTRGFLAVAVLLALGWQNTALAEWGPYGRVVKYTDNPLRYQLQGSWPWLAVGPNNPNDPNSPVWVTKLSFANASENGEVSCWYELVRADDGGELFVLGKFDWRPNEPPVPTSNHGFQLGSKSGAQVTLVDSVNGSLETGWVHLACYAPDPELLMKYISVSASFGLYTRNGGLINQVSQQAKFVGTSRWLVELDQGDVDDGIGVDDGSGRVHLTQDMSFAVANLASYRESPNSVRVRVTLIDHFGNIGPSFEDELRAATETKVGGVKGWTLKDIFSVDKLYFPWPSGNPRGNRIRGMVLVEALGATTDGKPIPISVLGIFHTFSDGNVVLSAAPATPILQ